MSSAAMPKTMSGRVEGAVPLILVGIVLLMVSPLPPFILDMLLATSIALAIGILLIAIYLEKPLDLSSFPTILLFVTLLRLALNIASTRLILSNGEEGTGAAGDIIRAFGEFMVGGNYLVGATIFLLLVIVNFIVITKGAGRVAEVSARFTLDALPGKQMSIDADLTAGLIDQAEAKKRRTALSQESDFFGSMDGASKFVRGDAVAGLLITGLNIVIGFIVGMVQHDMTAAESASTYTILTVGDGLVTQIPALVVSTAAGVIVTRAAGEDALPPTLVKQLSERKAALVTTAGILATIGILPGMPIVPFFTLAGMVYAASRAAGRYGKDGKHAAMAAALAGGEGGMAAAPDKKATEREQLENMLPLDVLELEVGFDLVSLVDTGRGGEIVERIAATRRNLATELGIIIPSVHIRDNLRLRSNQYRLMLNGQEIGTGELRPDRVLAMDPTGQLPPVDGEPVKEPAFGLPARWIRTGDREKAEGIGYTVVDAATVAATHITELLRGAAPELLGRTEAQELIDIFARREPKVVDELIPNLLPLGEVIKVMRGLLRESVSVRDMRSILEGLADSAGETKDTATLVERVRQRLARAITTRFKGNDGRVAALVLDPRVEQAFRQQGGPDAPTAQRILSSLDNSARHFSSVTTPPVIVCAPDVRRLVSEFLLSRIPGLSVISYREIDPKITVRTLGVVAI